MSLRQGRRVLRSIDAAHAMYAAVRAGLLVLLLVGIVPAAHAHIGSKDVFQQVQAGPYKLFVTVRTPLVIPGVATVEIRSTGAPVGSLQIAPVPLIGEASKHPPTPDTMKPSADDPAFYSGSLWLMASGSWQVRILIDGPGGAQTVGVPVPAMPLSVLPMQRSLGVVLAVLGVILIFGMTALVAAAVREARLAPGVEADAARRRRGVLAGVATLVLLIAGVWFGNKWWKVEAASYAADVYHPSDLHATLQGNTLELRIGRYDTAKKQWDSDNPSELLLDHQKVMHLYAIRLPLMDAAFHLHPVPDGHGLTEQLPAMPPGMYRLYADIVHRNGFPETLSAILEVPPGMVGAPLAADDAEALPAPLDKVISVPPDVVAKLRKQGGGSMVVGGIAKYTGTLGPSYKLPDGYTMVWDKPATINANTGYLFRFELLDPAGRPAADVQPYLGMAGHAAWVKTDGSTFAHTHPDGSAAMPAVMLAEAANSGTPASSALPGMDMPTRRSGPRSTAAGASPAPSMAASAPNADLMPDMPGMNADKPLSPTVEFPYGFPQPGTYRVFIQMKHGGTVETGVFDAEVK